VGSQAEMPKPGAGTGMPDWAAALFATAPEPLLQDAGETLVWAIRDDPSRATISDQFKANAEDYHQRYSAADHFETLFKQGLATTGVAVAPLPLVLDLGSGSGVNSIVPCLRLFPGARLIATDLSAELLAILARYMRQGDAADRVVCMKMDAMSRHVTQGAFDLVTGASILHHLEQPEAGIAAAGRALKPGGHAVFFEPFDGYGLIRLAYERILAEAGLRDVTLDPRVEAALRGMIADIAARTRPDPASAAFKALDDKWLFSRERIAAAARQAGFTDVQFATHNDHQTLYHDVAAIQLRLATGLDTLDLPDWAMAILTSYDAALTPAVKRLLMLEGTIVLTKG
jgi:SAM-dependent methyltransferase